MSDIKLGLIVAVAENGIIGRHNELPWHLPADLRHFKAMTMGKPVILGRKTFDSIGRPLPGRHFVVVTRDASWSAPGVEIAHHPDEALERAYAIARREGSDEVLVAGGAQLYNLYLDRADVIYRTLVGFSPAGDASFPQLGAGWRIKESRPETEGGLQICFQTLVKSA